MGDVKVNSFKYEHILFLSGFVFDYFLNVSISALHIIQMLARIKIC